MLPVQQRFIRIWTGVVHAVDQTIDTVFRALPNRAALAAGRDLIQVILNSLAEQGSCCRDC